MAGVELARAQLAEIGREVEPDLRLALNTTVRRGRKELYVPALLRFFPSRRFLNRSMVIKLAGTRRLNARIIPSSSGVPVKDRKGWSFGGGRSGIPTRKQIFVPDINGTKLAAGFVNPRGAKQAPLATHSSKARVLKKPPRTPGSHYRYSWGGKPYDALGPSVAYYFKRITTAQAVRVVNAMAQQEFVRRVRARLAKAG
ncbi:hypothetical protein PKB_1282 [Pseudomonas knackmussii B13]|uniref:Uncharacterized protein n=1 Tax=Pseudomonas knackmussii (strain DSM 6978 / CCUG 54928 / LMG 23759 / B13) TaxID=1301098 RepID=A0A024HDT0_PSEKB|nr:hypothetical protein [Pseudomonas knackmussii]CDF82647.1 hypothetical protein PKB_1282 [Pseudomonas knackmussii B13]